MWNAKKSVVLSEIACVLAGVTLIALIIFGRRLFDLYFVEFRQISDPSALRTLKRSLGLCVYPGSVLGLTALASLMQMLRNIYRGKVFIRQNVVLLRGISWCCFAVAALTLYGCIFYLPMAFLTAAAFFVGIILRVVKNVMQHAVSLREENDLTI